VLADAEALGAGRRSCACQGAEKRGAKSMAIKTAHKTAVSAAS
jgi:hypothetical protein